MHTQHIALALFLILVTVGIIVILSVAIVVKRRIARRKSRVERNTYTPCGYGLSKVWREHLERNLNATVRVRTEPQTFTEQYERNFDRFLTEERITFLYRSKAVDEFLKLKESILRVSPELEAPPIRGIQAFLLSARDQAMSPPASRERIEEYCRLYLWARHDLDPFGKDEYEKLCEIQKVLMDSVQRAAIVRHMSGSSTSSGPPSRAHSIKFLSTSRSFPKLDSTLIHHSKDDVPFATPRNSTGRSDPARLERGKPDSKFSSASLTLKRRRGHQLFVSSNDAAEMIPMYDRKSGRGVYTKQLVESDPSKTGSVPIASTSRRASCQSDGSQTALINLDPVIAFAASSKGLSQTTRHLRPSEHFDSVEMKPILPKDKEDPSESPKGGLENEAVNC